jgi:hypothetical protein
MSPSLDEIANEMEAFLAGLTEINKRGGGCGPEIHHNHNGNGNGY